MPCIHIFFYWTCKCCTAGLFQCSNNYFVLFFIFYVHTMFFFFIYLIMSICIIPLCLLFIVDVAIIVSVCFMIRISHDVKETGRKVWFLQTFFFCGIIFFRDHFVNWDSRLLPVNVFFLDPFRFRDNARLRIRNDPIKNIIGDTLRWYNRIYLWIFYIFA